jgi:hypothetical protein
VSERAPFDHLSANPASSHPKRQGSDAFRKVLGPILNRRQRCLHAWFLFSIALRIAAQTVINFTVLARISR